jgi:asparagine synthase (glutamine-hydrolysing)
MRKLASGLSGGLDSRAILAAIPDDYKPLHTFTFGQEGCDDIKIAKRIAISRGNTPFVEY